MKPAVPVKSAIPRYYAVWRLLWSQIANGTYPAGTLLGTEVVLARELGVSRATLREALALLEREGLVVRKRSMGTFVADDVAPRGVVEFTGYLEDVMLQAGVSRTADFSMERVDASPRIAEILRLDPGAPVLEIRRVRVTSDGVPRIYLIDYVPHAIAAELTEDELRDSSVLRLLDHGPERRIDFGHQTISSRIGRGDVCERLWIEEGSAVLYSGRVVFDGDGRPLGYVEMFYPGERFAFDIRLGRI